MGETGERLQPERVPAQEKTVQTIQTRIKVLIDNRIKIASVGEDDVPHARYRIVDPITKRPQIIAVMNDNSGTFSVEIPTAVDAESSPTNKPIDTPFFKTLSVSDSKRFVERGYYDANWEQQVEKVEELVTETEAQEFLAALNAANKENEIDLFEQTRGELEANKAKADIVRDQVDQILDRASKEGMIDVDIKEVKGADEYINIGEMAKVEAGNRTYVVLRNRSNGSCVIDIQGDTDFMYMLGEDGKDDPEHIGRPRLHVVIPSVDDPDQRIFVGVVNDSVENGLPVIAPEDPRFFDRSAKNVATDEDKRFLYLKLNKIFKEGRIVPPSWKGPDDLQGV